MTDQEKADEQERLSMQEQLDHRNRLRDAWVETAIERDRNLLMLSSGGIGLLLTIADKLPLSTQFTLCLFMGAVFAFLVSAISTVWIFHVNKGIVESQLNSLQQRNDAGVLDKLAVWGFAAGVFLSCTLTFCYAVDSYSNSQLKKGCITMDAKDDRKPKTESFDGIAKIKPTQPPTSAQEPSTTTVKGDQPQKKE